MLPTNSMGGQSVQIDTRLARVFRMKKGVMTTARLVNDRLKDAPIRWRPIMITLTYAKPDDWKPNQITDFVRRVQMYAKRRGYVFPNVWVMELTKAGVPHYHCLFWVPARLRVPHADRQGWWQHGSTNIIRVKNAVGYVAKYASKFESKDATFPHGCRIHGIGGITALEKRVVAWWKLPQVLRTGEEGSVAWNRKAGGGWRCLDTGECRESTWGLSAVGEGVIRLSLKRTDGLSADIDHGDSRQCLIEQTADARWRIDLNRQEYLADRRETNPAALVSFFEGVERGYLYGSASLEAQFRLNRLERDRVAPLRLCKLHGELVGL